MGITPQEFARMKSRLSGSRPAPLPVFQAASSPGAGLIILGIDPSLRGTGFGVIRSTKPRPLLLAHGTILSRSNWTRSRCLVQIVQTLRDVIRHHHPTVCVVEGLFYAQNFRTALIMGEARGASLVAVGEAGLEIYEIAARKVKQAIVGYGAAQKTAVARMVQSLLHLSAAPEPDAADALALALTYAQENGRYSLGPRTRI
jgi:crossover junction endodeoxyribonuclease RuvC